MKGYKLKVNINGEKREGGGNLNSESADVNEATGNRVYGFVMSNDVFTICIAYRQLEPTRAFEHFYSFGD